MEPSFLSLRVSRLGLGPNLFNIKRCVDRVAIMEKQTDRLVSIALGDLEGKVCDFAFPREKVEDRPYRSRISLSLLVSWPAVKGLLINCVSSSMPPWRGGRLPSTTD